MDGEGLRPGAVLIAPGDFHLEVDPDGQRVRVNQAPPENSCRPAADVLFRSVARTFGGRSIGVVLTGMGRDGFEGARALRASGSDVWVQDEDSSVVWGMPGLVHREGASTFVGDLEEIARRLIDRTRAPRVPRGSPRLRGHHEHGPRLLTDDFVFLRRFIEERSAIVLDESKDYLIEARLLPVAEREGLRTLSGLARCLRSSPRPDLIEAVVEAMTTNETSFFRDMAPFDCLKGHVLPEMLRARADERRLRIWCGAASSGQEPYSIMFIVHQFFPEVVSWDFGLLATDISASMVERTQSGVYSQLEVNRGLPAKMLLSNFQRSGMKWQVKDAFRDNLRAAQLNLIERWPPMDRMDIVFLRNVLIYFDVPTKKKILEHMKTVLKPDGYLFLGGAETTVGVDDDYERVDYPNASCYRLKSPEER